MAKISILGTGVIGLSVALSLKAAGHDVTCLSAKRLSDARPTQDPEFASAFPVASVIPRSVQGGGITTLLENSDQVFAALLEMHATGVRLQPHYELFEGDFSIPEYAKNFRDFTAVTKASQPNLPCRKGADVGGYKFSCLFADMTVYGIWLDAQLQRHKISHRCINITHADLLNLNTDIIINCLGAGAHRVFEDITPGFVYRGVLLHLPLDTPPHAYQSYNYTPASSVYKTAQGKRADVYFYPRSGHAVIGGSREVGTIDPKSGAYLPQDTYKDEAICINGIDVPCAIIDLNSELAEQFIGRPVCGPFTAYAGYRHAGGTPDAPQLTASHRTQSGLAPIIDCLGFGGAGVTLSWGVALKVCRLVDQISGKTPQRPHADSLVECLKTAQSA